MSEARNKLKLAASAYHARPTRSKKAKLDQAKKALDDAYLSEEAAYISGKLEYISKQHASKKAHLA